MKVNKKKAEREEVSATTTSHEWWAEYEHVLRMLTFHESFKLSIYHIISREFEVGRDKWNTATAENTRNHNSSNEKIKISSIKEK